MLQRQTKKQRNKRQWKRSRLRETKERADPRVDSVLGEIKEIIGSIDKTGIQTVN